MTFRTAIRSDCKASLIDRTDGSPLSWDVELTAGTAVTVLYAGADQDGWDGELICQLADGLRVAVKPEFVCGK